MLPRLAKVKTTKRKKKKKKKDAPAKKGEDDQADEGDVEEAHGHQADGGQEGEVRLRKEKCACDEEEGRWHFRAEGPVASVGIAVDLRGVNQTWEGPKPMFADKLLKIHFALDSFDVYKIDTLLHRSKLKKRTAFRSIVSYMFVNSR